MNETIINLWWLWVIGFVIGLIIAGIGFARHYKTIVNFNSEPKQSIFDMLIFAIGGLVTSVSFILLFICVIIGIINYIKI